MNKILRRSFSLADKRRIIAEYDAPGANRSAILSAHRITTTYLSKWRGYLKDPAVRAGEPTRFRARRTKTPALAHDPLAATLQEKLPRILESLGLVGDLLEGMDTVERAKAGAPRIRTRSPLAQLIDDAACELYDVLNSLPK